MTVISRNSEHPSFYDSKVTQLLNGCSNSNKNCTILYCEVHDIQ